MSAGAGGTGWSGRPGVRLVFLGSSSGPAPVIELTSETRATATDIPMSWVYLAVPTGCILIGIETLRLMARARTETRRGKAT
jgi:TRAP-type C4-dicarboxylate transport system permease small subunit